MSDFLSKCNSLHTSTSFYGTVAIILALSAGCMSLNVDHIAFQAKDPPPGKLQTTPIVFVMEEGMKNYQYKGDFGRINFGASLAECLEKSVQQGFSTAKVVATTLEASRSDMSSGILSCRVVKITDLPPGSAPQKFKATLLLEWTLQDMKKRLVWQQAVHGASEKLSYSATPVGLKKIQIQTWEELLHSRALRMGHVTCSGTL
jgi:hypothetical protein